MKFIYRLSKLFKAENSQKLVFIGIICLIFTLIGLLCSYIRNSVDTKAVNEVIISALICCSAFNLTGYIIGINAFEWYERQNHN